MHQYVAVGVAAALALAAEARRPAVQLPAEAVRRQAAALAAVPEQAVAAHSERPAAEATAEADIAAAQAAVEE